MARKAYRKWPDSTAGVRITSGAKRGISCVTYPDGGRHARRQERMVIDSPAPESALDDRRGSRERMRAQENEARDGKAMLVRINGDTEIWSQAKANKGPPYLHRRREARTGLVLKTDGESRGYFLVFDRPRPGSGRGGCRYAS